MKDLAFYTVCAGTLMLASFCSGIYVGIAILTGVS